MKEDRSRIEIKIDAAKRYFMWHFLSGGMPYYLICEYPKSGGSWVTQIVSDYLDIPTHRNKNAKFQKSVLHGHHLYNSKFRNVIYVIRDGRDVMVSAYYHRLFNNDRNAAFAVNDFRNKVPFSDYENIRINLPAFIEFMFTQNAKGFNKFNWSDFINSLHGKSANVIRYEDMLENTFVTMSTALNGLGYSDINEPKLKSIISKYEFSKQLNRKKGKEESKNHMSFLRKGISGDWKNYFSKESCEVFNLYAGDALIKAGYEKDTNWTTLA